MRDDSSWPAITALVCLTLLSFLVKDSKGKTLAQGREDTNVTRETIEELRHNLKKVLHFIEDLSAGNAATAGNKTTADKGRSGIPPDWRSTGEHLLADESVVKATANKAAKAVKESYAATLKTQKGMKQISKGLVELKKCLETFEKTVKV